MRIPFLEVSVPARPLLNRLMRRPFPDGARVAVVNLFAARPPKEVWPIEIAKAMEPHSIRGAAARAVLRQVYVQALEHFLKDEHIDEVEIVYLLELRFALQLSEDEIIEIERITLHPRFHRRLTDMLADGELDAVERHELKTLHDRLLISPWIAQQLTTATAERVVNSLDSDAVSDR